MRIQLQRLVRVASHQVVEVVTDGEQALFGTFGDLGCCIRFRPPRWRQKLLQRFGVLGDAIQANDGQRAMCLVQLGRRLADNGDIVTVACRT